MRGEQKKKTPKKKKMNNSSYGTLSEPTSFERRLDKIPPREKKINGVLRDEGN